MKGKSLEQKPPQLFEPIWTVLLTVGIFFGAQVWASILLAAIYQFGLARDLEKVTRSTDFNFLFIVLAGTIAITALHALLKTEFKVNLKTLGLQKTKLTHLGYAVLGFVVYFGLYLLVIILAKTFVPGLDLNQEQELGFSKTTTGFELLPIFVSLVVVPPLVEEIIFRGFLFTSLRRAKKAFVWAAIITSIVFAAAHLRGGVAGEGLLWIAALDTFILSMVMCYVREKSGSLWPSIGIHAIKNGLAFLVLFNLVQYLR